MCSQTGRGRLENRILGDGIFPEDGPDQILPGFSFAPAIVLRHEPAISRIERSHAAASASTPRCASMTRARLIVRCLFLATRLTSIARSAGMVTLWRTDDAVRVLVFDRLFKAPMISGAPAWCGLAANSLSYGDSGAGLVYCVRNTSKLALGRAKARRRLKPAPQTSNLAEIFRPSGTR
jgi:hypothetical protein